MLKKIIKIFTFVHITLAVSVIFSNNIFAAELIGPWSKTSSLIYPIASQASFISSGKINIIAGATSVVTSRISYSNITTGGSLTSWTINPVSYIHPLYWHTSARKNNYVYILGGARFPPYLPLNEVYYTDVSAGDITSWQTTTPLNVALQLGGSVVNGNYIYYAGGFNNNVNDIRDKVYYSPINSNGSLGIWLETTPLPSPLNDFGMIETGNKIVIIGGYSSTGGPQSKVWESEVLGNGSLGPWLENTTAELPGTLVRPAITKIGNYVVSVGGIGGGSIFANVYYSQIQANGSLGPWTQSPNSLPQPVCCGSLAATNTHLYYTGGHDGISYFNNAFYASIGEVSEGLEVPDIKQYSSPWNDDEYDNASNWSSNPTIERWGCALTSASMVLQYHNHNISPDGLNNWLNSQPDGYKRNGNLNWLAVSKYSKMNADAVSSALEFRSYTANNDTLNEEINSNRPAILKIPGHFVVAKGVSNSDFFVNDPASNTNSLLSEVEVDHGGPYSQINSYIPSTTDLSYIMFVINEGYNIHLFDQNGTEILGDYFLEEPLTDDVDGVPLSSETLGIFLYPKPENGFYYVEVSGPVGNYMIDSYIYDQDGNVNFSESLGILAEVETDTFLINLDKTNSEESSISEVSFESLIVDLKKAYNDGNIYKRGVYISLRGLVRAAKRSYERGRIHASRILLNVAKKEIKKLTPRFIDQKSADFLIIKINLLINSF